MEVVDKYLVCNGDSFRSSRASSDMNHSEFGSAIMTAERNLRYSRNQNVPIV